MHKARLSVCHLKAAAVVEDGGVGCMQRDPDCTAALKQGGLIGRPGASFGSDASHSRLELLMRPETFDRMAAKLEALSAH